MAYVAFAKWPKADVKSVKVVLLKINSNGSLEKYSVN